jgi:sugar lactone lactonase YvrE
MQSSVSGRSRPDFRFRLAGLRRSGLRLAGLGILLSAAAVAAQHSAVISLPDSILEPGTKVTWVKKVPHYCEGPATDGSGIVYFTEQRGNSDQNWPIWKIDISNPSDTGTRWVVQSNQTNGLFADANGRVYAAQKGKIARYKKDGSLDATLAASGTGGVAFNQANDLSVGKNGALYFTDLGTSVYYLDPSGQLKVAAAGLVGANGVEWIEEQNAVYVLEADGSQISRFDAGSDGTLTQKKKFISLQVPDGCDLDIHGNFYVGSYGDGAVHVINANGQDIGKIAFKMDSGPYNSDGDQGNICNCHFGGAENKTLFCTGDGGLFSIRLKIPGRAWPAATTTGLGVGPGLKGRMPPKKGFRADGRWWDGAGETERGPRLPVIPSIR